LWLGIIAFLGSIPMLFFVLLGGVVADRAPKRRLVILYQILSIVPALALAGLTLSRGVTIWQVAVLSFAFGTINAFDIPARQSFIVEMVGKADLPNAIALNSATFNGARLLGPAVAGLVIGAFASVHVGTAACFFLNAVSFVSVLIGLALMRLPETPTTSNHDSVWAATREGLSYIGKSRPAAALMVLVGAMAVFGWMFSVLMPVFAGDILQLGARGFGFLVSANGVGALTGALTLAVVADRVRPRKLLFTGIWVYCVSVSVFGISRAPWLSALGLVGTGWGLVMFFATANTALQRRVPDALRGRIMGIYALVFGGLSPFGSLLAGVLAQKVNAPFVAVFGAAVCAVCAVVIARLVPPTQAHSEL
jgi:MFS family permease